MLDVGPEQLQTITAILRQFVPSCKVLAFGSRVNGQAKTYSDLDLAVIGTAPLPLRVLGQLREAFEASELPFRVDVLDWHAVPESFHAIIQKNSIDLSTITN